MKKRLWTRLAAAAAAGMLAVSSFPVSAAAEALEVEAETEEMADAAAQEDTEETELPAEGDIVCGYEVTEVRKFDLMDADLVLFRHQKSGAQVLLIKNDDLNRAFNISFRTPIADNTGTPHVFEHATLSGSEKYPMDLFFNMGYQTYVTNLNAFTYQEMTMFPIASLSEAQLLSCADWYLDCCFHPLIMEDPYPFYTEAWRYELQDKDDELTINGTVYSEMLGAMDADTWAYHNFLRSMFPGSTYSTESGGLPEEIPNLTWDKLREFHDTYYVPSNSLACLYGDIEDYESFLELMSGYFDEYDDTPVEITDPEYVPVTEPVEATFSVGVEEGSHTENASYVYYGILTGLTDPDDGHRMDVVGSLLGSNTGRLAVALEKEYPEAEVDVFCGTDGPEYYLAFLFDHVNPEDADRLVELANESMQAAAEEGFPEEEVENIVRALERETRLITEDAEIGFQQIPNFNIWWSADGDPFRYADEIEALYHYQEFMDDGSALELLKSAALESTRTVLTITEPVAGLKEQQDAELAGKLAEIKASMSDEEIGQIVADTAARNAGTEKDPSQYISELRAVTVEELPEEIREYDVKDETDPETGVRWMSAVADADGIGTSRIMLDLSGVPQDKINWINLYVNLLGCLDTENYTKDALAQQLSLNSSSVLVEINATETDTDEKGYRPVLRLSTFSLTEETEELYRLLYEYIFRMKVDDTAAIRSYAAAFINQMRDIWNEQTYTQQIYRAESITDERMAYFNVLEGFGYVDFLREVITMLDEQPEAVTQQLEEAAEYLNNASNAMIMSAGEDAYIEVSEQAAAEFLGQLEEKEYEPQDYRFTAPAMAEGITIDSNVQYNLLYADYETLGLEGYTGDLDVLTSIIADGYLYPILRDSYGAYGAFHWANDVGIYVISYRDPQVAETFGTYSGLADVAASLADLDDETLDGYKMSCYAYYAKPQGVLAGAVNAMATELKGDEQEITLDYMREIKAVTAEDLAGYADVYSALIENGAISTTGSASVLKANADLYDVILAPFASAAESEDEELITESVTE
ncbi:MAG: insulinase family protein [Lachnospiraceae bacterium]|nr:insulinase family protein [Lachnospiraceae bacterium]